MKKFASLTLGLCAMFLMLVSCSKSSPIVGKWGFDMDQMGTKVSVTYEFNNDGTVSFDCEMESESPKMELDMEGSGEYTYNEVDKTLKVKVDPSKLDLKKLEMDGFDDAMKEQVVKSMKAQYASEETYSDVEVADGQLTMTYKGQKVTMKSK